MNAAKVKAFKALPAQPDHVSHPMFNFRTVQIVVELRLFGLTEGMWHPIRAGLETHDTARRTPTLRQRVAAERQLLLNGRRSHRQPGPGAA